MSELNSTDTDFDQGGVHKGVSVTLNTIMLLTQDPPSHSLNVNHGRLFNIPVASKTSGSARSSDSRL